MENEALLIVDMSNDFVNGSLPVGDPAIAIVPYIVKKANDFLANGGMVVVTMDSHEPNDTHFTLWPVHNVIGTEGQELYGDLKLWYQHNQDHPRVAYAPKSNYNAFFKTDLAEKLRDAGIQIVHVVGVCTDICDFLTIAGADAEGFKTVIHKQGVATFTDNTEVILQHMVTCFHTKILDTN